MGKSKTFVFDGGAATYLGTALLGWLITICTLGLAVPYAIVLRHRWKAKHTYINGHRLVFLGSGTSLFLNWLKWWFLSIVTLGIYLFWVTPRLQKWIVENTDFDPTWRPSLDHLPAAPLLSAPDPMTRSSRTAGAHPI